MSKSPYLSNPNILAHPDRIVQKVELDMTAQDSYLAGSPISAEGKLANDASAIGILLYDVHKAIGGRTGVVVIFGRIKQDVAAEHSGITISAEAKAALIDITFTGDGCRMGGGGLTELPEGYPYKESSKTEIVWDGNGDGLDNIGGRLFLVSPAILSDEEIKNGVVKGAGAEWIIAEHWDTYVSAGYVAEDFVMVADGFVIFVRKAGAEVMGTPIEKPGVYFISMNGSYIESFTTSSETIHTMAPEFLPAGVGGGGVFYVKFTTTDNTNYTADKTFAEIVAADAAGQLIIGQVYNGTVKGANLNLTGYMADSSNGVIAVIFANAYCFGDNLMMLTIMMQADGIMALNKTMALS